MDALANHFGLAVVNDDEMAQTNGDTIVSLKRQLNGKKPKPKPKTTNGNKHKITNGSRQKATNSAQADAATPDTSTEVSSDEDEADVPKVPVGSLASTVNLYWTKDDEWTADEPKDTKPAENEETARHAIVIRNKKSSDSRKKYMMDSIIVQSPQLKKALADIFKDYPGVFCDVDRLEFDAPFEVFMHRWGDLLKYLAGDLDETTREHLELLHAVLKEELKDVIQAYEDFVANGIVNFKYIWLIFQPGSVVVSQSMTGSVHASRIDSGDFAETNCGMVYRLYCKRVDWNGEYFGWATEIKQVSAFKGISSITDLSTYPLIFHPNKENLKRFLIQRGKNFEALAGSHYESHDGRAILQTSDGPVPIEHTGRVIVDGRSWKKYSGLGAIYVNTLGSIKENGSDDDQVSDVYQNVSGKAGVKGASVLTDYQLMLATVSVRGYSLRTKQWLQFSVDGIEDIEFNEKVFDKLVLPEEQKDLTLALAESQAESASLFDDVIQGKGKGMIILLSGPPGVGKTLTAEAVSEFMKVPLYMMSAGDLGIRPDEVEKKLDKILGMVASWKAILLIDECDVFLEARSIHDLERNKLVSIFLRLLEYYEGTLFLTTNRAENIDAAFQSRIHLSMAYPGLNEVSRKVIWNNFIAKTSIPYDFSDKDVADLARLDLNGRQIKNLMKTAQMLAVKSKKPLTRRHVQVVLNIQGMNSTSSES